MTRHLHTSVVSLFSGAGGLDLGLEDAGLRIVSATDFDADCIESLRRNQTARIPSRTGDAYLDGTHIILGPVESLEPRDLRPPGTGSRWFPDVLVGGPPCQPFSSAGSMRSVRDPRGRLFEHFVRLAQGLRPRAILFENVRGLVTARGPRGEPGEALALVKEAFEAIGYATSFALLNAADYGAPQRRVRCFMLASRVGPPPDLPPCTHASDPRPGLFGDALKPWVTLGDFLRDAPPPHEAEIVRPSELLAAALESVPEGSGLKSPGAREATRPGGHWGYKQGTFVADPKLPARTVTAASTQDWIRSEGGDLRRLTARECAALQGFPRAWVFAGSKASVFRQVGNAVPVVFGQMLGNAILDALPTSRRSIRKSPSIPLPEGFQKATACTRREQARNGDSRALARERLAAGDDLHAVKGLGSAGR